MNQILLVLKGEPEENIEFTGEKEMVDDKDLNDLDDVFEDDDNTIETNDISSSDETESQENYDSYMVSDDDYTDSIENHEEDTDDLQKNTESEEILEESTEDALEDEDFSDTIESSDEDILDDDLLSEDDEEFDESVEEKLTEGKETEEISEETEEESESEDNSNEIEEKSVKSSDLLSEIDMVLEENEKSEEDTDDIHDNSESDDVLEENAESEEIQEEKTEEEILNSVVDPVVEDTQDKINIMTSLLDVNEEDDYGEDIEEEDVVEETVKHVESVEATSPKRSDMYNPSYSYSDFKKNSFWKSIEEYQEKYTEEALNTYLEKFKNDKDNQNAIDGYYQSIIIQYGEEIDFVADEEARHYAWILAAGKFADLIERRKEMGLIDSSVEIVNRGKPESDIVEDEMITKITKERESTRNKLNSYGIDRTVFAIADDSSEDVSIFEDKKAVDKEFYEGPFYKIFKEVMTSDRCADMSKVFMKIIINPDTSFIPIVDFSTGVRFVCVDSGDVDQYRIHALALGRQIPFSFSTVKRYEVRTRVLYSDMCINRPVATIFAIKKLVAFGSWNKKRIITLQNNFAMAYTTETKFVEMFENGDPDSKNPENCVNITRKPKNSSIGIIALDKKSARDRQALRRRQGKKILERMANGGYYEEELSPNDYDIHFIIGADIICNDRDLVNPAIAPDLRCVHYQITRYAECNSVVILDGLQVLCAAIIKEHFKKYGNTTKYSIEFEYDPTELLTPGVMALIDNHDGLEPSTYKRSNPMSIVSTYIMPPSRLKMEGIFEFEKGRVDGRNFNAATIGAHYPQELWSRYNLSTIEGRAEFLRSRGFEEFWQPAIAVFDVMPYVLRIIEVGSLINELCDISLQNIGNRDSGDMENLLYRQQKLEYFKKLENSNTGGFQKFLYNALDFMLNFFDNEGNQN